MKNITVKINVHENNKTKGNNTENHDADHIENIIKEAAHISFIVNRIAITTNENIIIEQIRRLQ